jgi:large subunit ribosomal protein L29
MTKKLKINKELRELSTEELKKRATKSRRELLELRFQKGAQQLTNPLKLRENRRQIARLLTVIKEKENDGGKVQK